MPQQYTVPQFIDTEDKIFGPITARQFVILMVAGMTDFLLYKLLSFIPFLLIGVPFLILCGIIAFVRVNGQPFHFFILNIIQTFKKPHIRVWDKSFTDAELKEFIKHEAPFVSHTFVRKARATSSKLQELTLIVNTGGVYKPEE